MAERHWRCAVLVQYQLSQVVGKDNSRGRHAWWLPGGEQSAVNDDEGSGWSGAKSDRIDSATRAEYQMPRFSDISQSFITLAALRHTSLRGFIWHHPSPWNKRTGILR